MTKTYIVQVKTVGNWRDHRPCSTLDEAQEFVAKWLGRARIVEVTRRVVLLKEE